MRIKLNPSACRGPFTSQKTGRQFYSANSEASDPGGSWATCRWSIMSGSPIPCGKETEYAVISYDAQKGVGMARPLAEV